MATSVKVKMKNGEVKDFPHIGRADGSFTKSVRYEGAFVIIVNEFYNEIYNETAIPALDIEEVQTRSHKCL